jgi:hypothetical protein
MQVYSVTGEWPAAVGECSLASVDEDNEWIAGARHLKFGEDVGRALLATFLHADFFLGLFFDPEDGSNMFPRNTDLFATCFHAGFFLGLIFDPEDGGDIFLRNRALLATFFHASSLLDLWPWR